MSWHKVRAASGLLLAAFPIGCLGSGDDSSATAAASTPAFTLDCASSDAGDWPMYGQNVCNSRGGTVAGDPINATSVAKLKVKWMYADGGDISTTPAVVGGQVYVPDWDGNLTRFDGQTGHVVWSKSVGALVGLGDVDAGAVDAGGTRSTSTAVSRITPIVFGNSVIFGMGSAQSSATLAAIDKDSAALKWKVALDPHPAAILTGSPALENGVVYIGVSSFEEGAGLTAGYVCCSFRGSVVAVDAATGSVKWKTPMIDDSVYYLADGKTLSGYSGVAIWSGTPTIDRKRKLVYVTTGNNYSVPMGATNPPPAGDHVESILALDLETGAIKWAQRMVADAGDIWTFQNMSGPDYDFGDGAHLFQATIDGKLQDVVGAGQKSGVYWAVSADTGAELWHTQVGPGGHLGGIHWGTAVDENGIYVGVNNEGGTAFKLGGSGAQKGKTANVGAWAALALNGADGPSGKKNTGKILWEIANPAMTAPYNLGSVNGPIDIYNGVIFAGSMDKDGEMFALEAKTGAVLWKFQSGASVYSGPAISNGTVYWGAGYPSTRLALGSSGPVKLYAFEVGK